MTPATNTNETHRQASRKYRLNRDEALASALSAGNPWSGNIRAVARQAVVEALDPTLAAQLKAEVEARP